MADWRGLYRWVTARHLGVLHLSDVGNFGLAPQTLRGRARSEGWLRPFPSTWLLPGTTATPEVLTYAALRALGGRAVVDRRSALAAVGLGAWPSTPQVILPHDRRYRTLEGLEVHRSRRLVGADVEPRGQLLIARTPRALLHLCADGAPTATVRGHLVDALQRRLTTRRDVVRTLHRTRGLPGRPRLDRIVAGLLADWVDSALEQHAREALAARGLVPTPAPFPLATGDGRAIHLDIAFPRLWHALECDGAGAHMDRRSFETDRVRWGRAQRAGVTLTWVTRRRLLHDLDGIVEEVDAAIARAARDPRPPMRPAHDCQRAGCR